jgi:hypothetical protein
MGLNIPRQQRFQFIPRRSNGDKCVSKHINVALLVQGDSALAHRAFCPHMERARRTEKAVDYGFA